MKLYTKRHLFFAAAGAVLTVTAIFLTALGVCVSRNPGALSALFSGKQAQESALITGADEFAAISDSPTLLTTHPALTAVQAPADLMRSPAAAFLMQQLTRRTRQRNIRIFRFTRDTTRLSSTFQRRQSLTTGSGSLLPRMVAAALAQSLTRAATL